MADFIDPAAAFDTTALSASEIDRVREIVQTEALSTVTTLCGNLSASQLQHTRYDLDQFFNQVGEGTVRMKGGSDGVDFDATRDRNVIRNRVRARLNLPGFSSSGLFRINVAGAQANYGSEY